MTDAQVWGVHYGYEMRREKRSSDFRMLYSLYFNANSKKKIRSSKLWLLPYLDFIVGGETPSISKEKQRKIIENVDKMLAKMAQSKDKEVN
jgi:hypothetical protein